MSRRLGPVTRGRTRAGTVLGVLVALSAALAACSAPPAPPASGAASSAPSSSASSSASSSSGASSSGASSSGSSSSGSSSSGASGPAARAGGSGRSAETAARLPATTAAAPAPTVAGAPLVVLDPGHNGDSAAHLSEINKQVYSGFGQYKACNTTGTDTNAGYPEHAFNWDVAVRVRSILQSHGVRVIMTRPNDSGWGPCVNVRAAIESTAGARAAVAIHADGGPSGGHGFHVNLCSRTPEGATSATVASSKALGTDLRNSLAASSGLVPSTYIGTDGMVYRSDFAGLNLSTSPTAFLELGNMRNGGDAALQTSASGRQRIAAAVASGIMRFLAA